MIVVDASAIVEVLLAGPRALPVKMELAYHSEVHVPDHFHVEVVSALRRYALRGELTDSRAVVALNALYDLRAIRYPVIEMYARAWDRRQNLSAYDAAYIVLADRLNARLLTLDAALSGAAEREALLAPLRF